MSSDDFEEARLSIERDRLELDKSKAAFERRFLRANSGVLISAAVSFAALIVSVGHVWVTNISKKQELEMARSQQLTQLEQQRVQKEKEMQVLELQRKREWDLSAAKFVTDNRTAIFQGSQREQLLFSQIIRTVFSSETSKLLVSNRENASTGPSKRLWNNVRNSIETGLPVATSRWKVIRYSFVERLRREVELSRWIAWPESTLSSLLHNSTVTIRQRKNHART